MGRTLNYKMIEAFSQLLMRQVGGTVGQVELSISTCLTVAGSQMAVLHSG